MAGVRIHASNETRTKGISADIPLQSVYVTTMIHHMLRRGKKTTAVGIMYDALDMVQQKTGRHPIEVA